MKSALMAGHHLRRQALAKRGKAERLVHLVLVAGPAAGDTRVHVVRHNNDELLVVQHGSMPVLPASCSAVQIRHVLVHGVDDPVRAEVQPPRLVHLDVPGAAGHVRRCQPALDGGTCRRGRWFHGGGCRGAHGGASAAAAAVCRTNALSITSTALVDLLLLGRYWVACDEAWSARSAESRRCGPALALSPRHGPLKSTMLREVETKRWDRTTSLKPACFLQREQCVPVAGRHTAVLSERDGGRGGCIDP